jgi:hypothetical protein
LRSGGFARTRGGYSFPGTDDKKIKRALIFNKLMKKNKNIKPPEDPKLKIHPLDPGGSAKVSFNQRMIAPKKGSFLHPNLYDNTFGISAESLNDGTIFKASFVKKNK